MLSANRCTTHWKRNTFPSDATFSYGARESNITNGKDSCRSVNFDKCLVIYQALWFTLNGKYNWTNVQTSLLRQLQPSPTASKMLRPRRTGRSGEYLTDPPLRATATKRKVEKLPDETQLGSYIPNPSGPSFSLQPWFNVDWQGGSIGIYS